MRVQRNGALLTAWAFLLVTASVDAWAVRAITAAASLAAAFYAGMVTQYLDDLDGADDTTPPESEEA